MNHKKNTTTGTNVNNSFSTYNQTAIYGMNRKFICWKLEKHSDFQEKTRFWNIDSNDDRACITSIN